MDDTKKNGQVPLFGARWTMSVLGLVGFIFVYGLRVNLSVAMVCMVKTPGNQTNTSVIANSSGYSECDPNFKVKENTQGEFDWDRSLQGQILSSFFYGYFLTQIPGGWLSERYGGKWVFGGSMILTSIATLLVPICARTHWGLLIMLRVFMGITTGVTFPCMHALWGKWAPKLERSKLATVCYSGTMIGNIIFFGTSGLMCTIPLDNGWPFIFYISGGACLIWCVFWTFFAFDSPAAHPRIDPAEREHIETSIGLLSEHKELKTPWLSFVKSGPVWAVLVAHICNNWGNYTILTSLPTYMKEVLKFDIRANGLLSALPYATMFIAAIGGGQVADFLREREILSTTWVRKIFQTTASIVPAVFMIATGFMDCTQRNLAVAFVTIAITATSACRSGFQINHIDIAPRYAGSIYGITNTISTLPGILAPIVVGEITAEGTQAAWQPVWYICAAFYASGAIIYLIFASGEEQHWAMTDEERGNNQNSQNKTEMDIVTFKAPNRSESNTGLVGSYSVRESF